MSTTDKTAIDLKAVTMLPNKTGHFGPYGGRFVSETLMSALDDLTELYDRLSQDPEFQKEYDYDDIMSDGGLYYLKFSDELVNGNPFPKESPKYEDVSNNEIDTSAEY